MQGGPNTAQKLPDRRDDAKFDLVFESLNVHIRPLFRSYESGTINKQRFHKLVLELVGDFADGDQDILDSLRNVDEDSLIIECKNRLNPPPLPPRNATRSLRRVTSQPFDMPELPKDAPPHTHEPPTSTHPTPSPDFVPQPTHEVSHSAPLDIFEAKVEELIERNGEAIDTALAESRHSAIKFVSDEIQKGNDFSKLREVIAIRYRLPIIIRILSDLNGW